MVAGLILLDQLRVPELAEPLRENARRHGVATALERLEARGSQPELPEDPQRPTTTEPIE
jgi:hypothetical protein